MFELYLEKMIIHLPGGQGQEEAAPQSNQHAQRHDDMNQPSKFSKCQPLQ